MKLSKTILTILFTASMSQVCYAFSKPPTADTDVCPAVDTIQQIGTTYTASGGWTGQVQKNPAKVKAFDFVLYKPTDIQHPFKEGQLLRCIYKLNNDAFLDLHLPKSINKTRISDPKNWKPAYGGTQYYCEKSPINCKFHLAK